MAKSVADRFKEVVSRPEFKGWPVIGGYRDGLDIPYYGKIKEFTLQTPRGLEERRIFIRSGWAVVFARDIKGDVIALCQWKPGSTANGVFHLEFSPGGIGFIAPGTTQEEILRRTQEVFLAETGYGGGCWESLGPPAIQESAWVRGASVDGHGLEAHLFMATGLEEIAEPEPNSNEIIQVFKFSLDEIVEVYNAGLLAENSAEIATLRSLGKLGRFDLLAAMLSLS